MRFGFDGFPPSIRCGFCLGIDMKGTRPLHWQHYRARENRESDGCLQAKGCFLLLYQRKKMMTKIKTKGSRE
jgi:hypothetical protein